jgi:hypothetical protein
MEDSPIRGADFSYTDALNHLTYEYNKKQVEEGKSYQKMPIRPSSSGNCERELAYSLNEYRGIARYEKKIIDPELSRIFSLGHSVEYALIKDIKQYLAGLFQVRYQQQVLSFMRLESKVDPKFSSWVEGSIDLVLWSDTVKLVADVKSKKEKYSNYRDSDWTDTNEKYGRMASLQKIGETGFYAEDIEAFLKEVDDPFLAANILQINLYAMNNFLVERGIDHAALFYYSKNTSRLRELRFKPSQALSDYVLNKFKSAFDAVEQGDVDLAKKEFRLGSMKCAFCNFNKTCWSDSDPLKAWFKTFPPKQWPTDTHAIDGGEDLERLYDQYLLVSGSEDEATKLDLDMCNILVDNRVSKVRFADGNIYEVKLYKSPKEHYRLKRSK